METLTFKNYSVDIVNIIDEENSGYDGVTLFYLLKGSATVLTPGVQLTLTPQELLLVNQCERYHISSTVENTIVKVAISHRYFNRYYANYSAASFSLDSDQNIFQLNMLREIITRLAISKLQSHKETGLLEINALLSNLLSLLIMYFKHKKPHLLQERSTPHSTRIESTLNYLQENYHKPLSLTLLAEINHTSAAYFSRLFSQEVGISFKTYLTQLRFSCCLNALAKTNKPLYQIVEENGFTDTRNFTALFKTRYAMTPNQYRSLYRAGKVPSHPLYEFPAQIHRLPPARFGDVHAAELLALLAHSLSINEQSIDIEPLATEKLTVTIAGPDKPSAALPHPGYIANVGQLEEILKTHVQQQILNICKEMPLQFAQVEHILSESTLPEYFPTDENCPSFSRYARTDAAVEFLRKQGIALLISVRFQPTEEQMRAYTLRLLDFIAHNITLFGAGYISSWAISYVPDTEFLSESETRFLRLRSKIKAFLPDIKMGCFYPFPTAKQALTELPFFTSYLAQKIDFLGFSADANLSVCREGFEKEDIADAERFVQQQALNIIEQLKKNALTTPLFLQTWNTLTGDTRQTNGSFFRGALLMNTLLSLPQQIASVGFWINSEVQKETREDKRIDTSSLALFYVANTRRPMFHVLRLRERLIGTVVARGENYLVTSTAQGYRVLLSNSVTFNPCLSLQEHLIEGFRKQLSVTITGMEEGVYQIKRHLFDQQHGALYHQFECQPTRFGRDSEVMQFIDLHSAPDLHLYDETIRSCWKISVEMDVNALYLYEINRITTP